MRWLLSILAISIATQLPAGSSRDFFIDFGKAGQQFTFADLPRSQQVGESYLCRFPKNAGEGWVPEQLALSLRGAQGVVSDGIIAFHHDGPRTLRARQGRGDKVILRWSVRNVRDAQRKRTNFMLYELHLRRGGGQARLFVRPEQFSTKFRGAGVCTRR